MMQVFALLHVFEYTTTVKGALAAASLAGQTPSGL